ncbi:hypothetical protein [Pectobacterium brasiliense]|uniref:hypothetical protein n=1 Tax=Pectobacterium brasiliense TaxID=180957 RepID=UPI0015DDFC1F|nr:hypothetical protein [Pectobacterium brasiliense]MBA0208567.1 hypothetical protein [Pectobacterium brasiliense]
MASWYFLKGKSVKALNDFALFISAAFSSYFYMFDYSNFILYSNVNMLCNDIDYLIFKTFLLVFSFSKAWISLIEFGQERNLLIMEKAQKDNNSNKELFFHKISLSLIEILRKKR